MLKHFIPKFRHSQRFVCLSIRLKQRWAQRQEINKAREREKQTKVLREPRDIMKQMNKHTKREVSYESSDCVFSWDCDCKQISKESLEQTFVEWGRGGGQVVSMLAYYSDVPSSNPADAYRFFPVKFVFEKNENKQKRGGGRSIVKICWMEKPRFQISQNSWEISFTTPCQSG